MNAIGNVFSIMGGAPPSIMAAQFHSKSICNHFAIIQH